MRSVDWSLYAITPDDVDSETLFDRVCTVLAAGATVLQLRRKGGSTRRLVEEARRIVEAARPYGVPVLVNDRVDVALAVGADGVHLGQEDLCVEDARCLAGEQALVGASTHGPEEAEDAVLRGASYVAVGPVYASPSKRTGPPVGPEGVRAVRRAVEVPVIAVGGILPEHVGDLLMAGASGVAVISGIFGADSVSAQVEAYLARIAEAKRALRRG